MHCGQLCCAHGHGLRGSRHGAHRGHLQRVGRHGGRPGRDAVPDQAALRLHPPADSGLCRHAARHPGAVPAHLSGPPPTTGHLGGRRLRGAAVPGLHARVRLLVLAGGRVLDAARRPGDVHRPGRVLPHHDAVEHRRRRRRRRAAAPHRVAAQGDSVPQVGAHVCLWAGHPGAGYFGHSVGYDQFEQDHGEDVPVEYECSAHLDL